ncbi:MAG: hypothetical protein JWR19_1630 [Pedosphaera sp.]|nr:hypothetical protein [Pedosphaera sp.]
MKLTVLFVQATSSPFRSALRNSLMHVHQSLEASVEVKTRALPCCEPRYSIYGTALNQFFDQALSLIVGDAEVAEGEGAALFQDRFLFFERRALSA